MFHPYVDINYIDNMSNVNMKSTKFISLAIDLFSEASHTKNAELYFVFSKKLINPKIFCESSHFLVFR